jgi:hypothetical protein
MRLELQEANRRLREATEQFEASWRRRSVLTAPPRRTSAF